MLGGSDPLSELEHQALFRDVSKGQDRIKYRVSSKSQLLRAFF